MKEPGVTRVAWCPKKGEEEGEKERGEKQTSKQIDTKGATTAVKPLKSLAGGWGSCCNNRVINDAKQRLTKEEEKSFEIDPQIHKGLRKSFKLLPQSKYSNNNRLYYYNSYYSNTTHKPFSEKTLEKEWRPIHRSPLDWIISEKERKNRTQKQKHNKRQTFEEGGPIKTATYSGDTQRKERV
jgi:hypothetical protein